MLPLTRGDKNSESRIFTLGLSDLAYTLHLNYFKRTGCQNFCFKNRSNFKDSNKLFHSAKLSNFFYQLLFFATLALEGPRNYSSG